MDTSLEILPAKRPASHKWAIFAFGFIPFAGVIFVLDSLIVDGVFSYPFTFDFVLLCALSGASLVRLVYFPRCRGTYYLSACTFFICAVRAVYSSVIFPIQQFLLRGINPMPGPPEAIGRVIALSLMAWLVFAFIFGRPSRRYFCFLPPSLEKNDSPTPLSSSSNT